ncbi:uncharacterized protein NPIL_376161 [Nephila pilipes]|uniref:Cuticular protein n=1 Tax=Nephila pilipes TaxID=299642 RepID=A0A8X6NGZ1_NEPPI|nr:uncharacterized protein NPIL_376161 [Nephila pilipes]
MISPVLTRVLFASVMIVKMFGAIQMQNILTPPVVELPRPYNFGFEFGDGLGMSQYRHETADGTGSVKGSYGYLDPLGVFRNVDYVAGTDGFKTIIKSNEPGLSNHVAADATYIVRKAPLAATAQGLRKAAPLK